MVLDFIPQDDSNETSMIIDIFLKELCITACEWAGLNWTSDFLTLKPGNHPFTGSHLFLLVKLRELFLNQ